FWELLIGAILACISMDHEEYVDGMIGRLVYARLGVPQEKISLENIKSVIGAILLVVSFVLLNSSKAYPGWWALGPTLGTAFMIWAGPEAWINKKILASAPFVFVGLI